MRHSVAMSDFSHDVVAEAIDYLVTHYKSQPDLDALANRAGYETTHFQKLFKERVGISPKRLIQYLTLNHARDFLLEGASTLEAAYQSGLSSSGRLHDLFVSCEAVTPGAVQRRGEGMVIAYGYHPSPIGEILVGLSDIGVCWLGFSVDQDRTVPFKKMKIHWPRASFQEDKERTARAADHILRIWRGKGEGHEKLTLDLQGTNFQIQVWQAMLKIPAGMTLGYQDIARSLGDEKASRAVGTAVGSNPISLLIPCHRVIQKSGIVENYAWGTPRKKLLLAMEGLYNKPEAMVE